MEVFLRMISPIAVLLTGGRATRLRPLSLEFSKGLIPLLNRPMLLYALERLCEIGIKNVVVVVRSPEESIEIEALDISDFPITLSVVIQAEPNGPAGAVAQVPDETIRGKYVIVIASDSILFGGDLSLDIKYWEESGAEAWLPLSYTDRPNDMGIAELDGQRVVSFVEKPRLPQSNLACVAWWMLSPDAVDRILDEPVTNTKGELEISGTLSVMIQEGKHIGGREFDGQWFDTGSLRSLLFAQSEMLNHYENKNLISPDAQISGCQIGNNVVIGENCVLNGAVLENVLVSPGAKINNVRYDGAVITPSGKIGRPQ